MSPDPFAGVRKMRRDRHVAILTGFTYYFGWPTAVAAAVWWVTRA